MMDLFLEDREGRFVECAGICGAEPGLLPGDDPRFPRRRPCRLPEGHTGRHESWIPRQVFDSLLWEKPTDEVVAAIDGRPVRLVLDGGGA